MKTKNTVKKTVIIFQVFAILFLILGFLGGFLRTHDYDILLFDRTVLMPLCMFCFLLFYLLETIMVIVLVIKTEKSLIFLTYLVLVPLILLHLYVWFIGSSTVYSVNIYKYPEFDTAIVIENGDDLFGIYANIYETKNNFLLKDIAYLDECLYPQNENSANVKIKDNKIIYTYYDSFDDCNQQLILEYDNGHFKEVTD